MLNILDFIEDNGESLKDLHETIFQKDLFGPSGIAQWLSVHLMNQEVPGQDACPGCGLITSGGHAGGS